MKKLITLSIVLMSCAASFGAAWEPAESPLMTPWAKDVSPESVWPQYPRPQMVRENWQNLNGLWNYAIVGKDAERPGQWDGEILVPFAVESALSGVGKRVSPEQALWYQRTFRAPRLRNGERCLLHFGAVDWQATIWVNGQEVGEHTGGFDPFEIDITEALKRGQNELVLRVWDPTDAGTQPRGKQVLRPEGIYYTPVSGIWQTVWLETVPATYIQSLKITPDIDRGVVSVQVNASGEGDVTLTALDGKKTVAEAKGKAGQAAELKIEDAKLWGPGSPFLYGLEVALVQDGKTVDRVESYFGMRKIEVRKDSNGMNRLFLNNEILFQYGPLDQGWWPDGLFTPATEEAIVYDLKMTQEYGMNMIRKHVKVESALWYHWCDKMGLLVWQDMPTGNFDRTEESRANYRKELKAMIDDLYNYPSIVMWVTFNEGWGQHDTPDVVKWTQAYDPSRPINEASGWHNHGSGDVRDIHVYPGPATPPLEDDRVAVLGEFGGLGMPIQGHLWQKDRNWGYVSYQTADELTDAYVMLLTQMRPLIGQGLSAAVYTQTSDVEGEVNGLLTYDRKVVKIDVERAAAAANKLYLAPPKVTVLVPTSRDKEIVWTYTTQTPGEGWFQPTFDDSGWQRGPGGFGTASTPNTKVRTTWDGSDIWLRRTFTLDEVPADGELAMHIHHDEDAEVYLNGQLIDRLENFTTNYVNIPLGPAARQALKAGENTLAVHCRQTEGGQYIDLGLTLMTEQASL